LVLGTHPADAETTTTPAWVRFAALGDPERGFAQFGTETWCYVRRGPYAGFALVGPGARPGLVIDHMDQVLLAAEEGRSRHGGLRGTEAATVALVSKPRSHQHPEPVAPEPLVLDAPAPVVVQSSATQASDELPPLPESTSEAEPDVVPAGDGPGPVEPRPDPFAELVVWGANGPAAGPPPGPLPPEPLDRSYPGSEHAQDDTREEPGELPDPETETPGDAEDEGDDVDRFSLAREFGQLLQGGEDPADV